MKKIIDDIRLIFKCCSLYYQDEKSQQEICSILGISRPTVSRMLKLGRERGIVKIEINNPDNIAYGNLERELEKRLELREVIIVESSPLEMGTKNINSSLGKATLDFLSRALSDGDYVGVTMGMTLQNVIRADYVIDKEINCTFVPIVGGVGESRLDIHSNYLVKEMADLFSGSCIQFLSPALFSDEKVLAGFWKEKSIQNVLKAYRKINLTVMGIGIPNTEESTILQTGYVDSTILESFVDKGAVGDIALKFFDIDGHTEPFESFNRRVAGMAMEDLKRVPRRVGIVGGQHKARAVMGAIRGGYINILITDVDCATELLNYKL